MSYKPRALLFVMMILAFLLMTFNSIHAHAADAAPQAAAAPTTDDIVGAIVVFGVNQDPEDPLVIFTLKGGTIVSVDGDKCMASAACVAKLKELMDSKHVLPLEPYKQPDIQS